jgi:hypothetical protein
MLRVMLGKTDARTAHGKLYFYDTIFTTPRFEPSAGRGGSNQIGSWPSILIDGYRQELTYVNEAFEDHHCRGQGRIGVG